MICFLFLCHGGVAQNIESSQVPAIVKTKLFLLYPQAHEIEWEKESENYVANFELMEREIDVTFDEKGKFIRSETELEVSQLPQKVKEYVQKHYKLPIEDASKLKTTDGKVNYEADITGVDLFFDEKGNFLREEKPETKEVPATEQQ